MSVTDLHLQHNLLRRLKAKALKKSRLHFPADGNHNRRNKSILFLINLCGVEWCSESNILQKLDECLSYKLYFLSSNT